MVGTMARLHYLLGWGLALFTGMAASQGSFTVTPLRVDIAPKATGGVIEVINTSAGTMTVQAQQRAWVQINGSDGQEDTRDLILSPAVFALKPGEKQVVRIALRGAPDARRERAYRLLVSELPNPQVSSVPVQSGFRIALRMDLPVFVAPLQPASSEPSYAFDPATSRLHVRNAGTAHIRFTDFKVMQAGRTVAELPVFTVLPGGERTFELPRERVAAGEVRVQAQSNAGPVDAVLAAKR